MKENKQSITILFEKLTELYLLLMLSVFLAFPGLGGYAYLTSHKWILFAGLSGGYLVLCGLLALELAILGHRKLQSPAAIWRALQLPQKLVILFWCCTGLSTICAVDPVRAFWGSGRLEGLLTITLYCGCFLLVSRWGRPKCWMLWASGISMSINCVIALLQLAGRNPLSLYPTGMTYFDSGIQYEGQFLGTIGNTNLLSAVLCIAIPAFFSALLTLRNKRRFLLLIPLTLCLIVWVKAEVAGGVIGVLGSILLSLPVLVKKKAAKKWIAVTLAALLLVSLLVVYIAGDHLGGALYEAHELMHGRVKQSFGSGRLFIWRVVWKLVPERPLLGGGPDTLGLRSTAYFEHYDEQLDMMIRSKIDTAHNEYLGILVNQGLPALIFYWTALAVAAVQWVKRADKDPEIAICGIGVLGYCIQAFFGISSPITTPFLWLMFGLLLASGKRETVSQSMLTGEDKG